MDATVSTKDLKAKIDGKEASLLSRRSRLSDTAKLILPAL
jgi:hypothetical protein